MNWTPTEGQKQADAIVQRLVGAASATGATTTPLFAWHMMDVIAKAIDQALAEVPVAARLALDGTIAGLGAVMAHAATRNGHADPDAYSELPPWATAEEGPREPLPPLPPLVFSDGTVATVSIPDAPKKRGRPPGPAKKKKAKRKAAKAVKAETQVVEAFEKIAEVVTAEAPAEPAP